MTRPSVPIIWYQFRVCITISHITSQFLTLTYQDFKTSYPSSPQTSQAWKLIYILQHQQIKIPRINRLGTTKLNHLITNNFTVPSPINHHGANTHCLSTQTLNLASYSLTQTTHRLIQSKKIPPITDTSPSLELNQWIESDTSQSMFRDRPFVPVRAPVKSLSNLPPISSILRITQTYYLEYAPNSRYKTLYTRL